MDRWLARAAATCSRFNHRMINRLRILEMHAAETRSLVRGSGDNQVRDFAAIEVWSRLWPSTIVGIRSYRNTLYLSQNICMRMKGTAPPLTTLEGFKLH